MRLQTKIAVLSGFWLLFSITLANASLSIPMYAVDTNGKQKAIGQVTVEKAKCGILLTPHLRDLPPGIHGFHIHDKPSCEDHAMAAAGHYDPKKTNKHSGPYKNTGHLGDLPVLIVNQDGAATIPVLAPRLTLSTIKNHALMIHEGGDNYSDEPEKLGGGGARIACGIIS